MDTAAANLSVWLQHLGQPPPEPGPDGWRTWRFGPSTREQAEAGRQEPGAGSQTPDLARWPRG